VMIAVSAKCLVYRENTLLVEKNVLTFRHGWKRRHPLMRQHVASQVLLQASRRTM